MTNLFFFGNHNVPIGTDIKKIDLCISYEKKNMADQNWQASNSLTKCIRIMYENHLDDGDITFKVGTEGAVVRAHKFILMCRSSVLCDMVKDGEESKTLTIREIEPDIFHQFLE